MVRARVYRHDVRCPDCGSNWMRRDGCSRNGHQIYKCGDCKRRHTPEGAYRRPGPAIKERALETYAECGNLSAVGRLFQVSGQAVSVRVKKGGVRPEPVPGGPASPH